MFRLLLFTFSLILLSFFISCDTNSNSSTGSKSTTPTLSPSPKITKGMELLDQCISAHGGMDNWNKFVGLSYEVESRGKSLYQITQLKDRRTYSKSKDFELGSDGKQIWVKPNADKVPGKSASFYYNLDFYFMAIPFVLKDPGVQVTYMGKATPEDQAYDLLKISYDTGVGLSAEDLYFLYLDTTTHQLKILTYTVSYFDKTNEKVNTAKKYLDYQSIQGIMMPTKLENYRWIDEKIGEYSNRDRVIKHIKFYETIPDEKVFEVPSGASTEDL